jgi:hypothetical protein
MFPKRAPEIHTAVNPFTAEDVAAILRERGWLRHENEVAASGGGNKLVSAPEWMAEAAALLGPRAENREGLARLLALIFEYDAGATLAARMPGSSGAGGRTASYSRAGNRNIERRPSRFKSSEGNCGSDQDRASLFEPRNFSSAASGACRAPRRRRIGSRCPAAGPRRTG